MRDARANRLLVTFPHAFFEAWFSGRARSCFEEQARRIFGAQLEIQYTVPGKSSSSTPLSRPSGFSPVGSPPFGEDWTFETFVSNAKHKWILGVLRELLLREPAALCPLVIGGATGSGKTHLLRATANELFRSLGEDAHYMGSDELTDVLKRESRPDARTVLRRKKVLLLDDAHRLSALPKLQDELILLLDSFSEQKKPLILAGTGRIADWALHPDLRSRMEAGLWAEMPDPDLDIRLRFLQSHLKLRRVNLDRDQLLMVAQRCTDMRRLSGAARRLIAHKTLLGRELGQRDIENILYQTGDTAGLTPQKIITLVGEQCGVTGKEILGDNRRPDMVRARQLAMFLCRDLLGHSYPVIGRLFGGKDHSTVIHAVKKIKQLQERDRLVHTMVTELTKACREREI